MSVNWPYPNGEGFGAPGEEKQIIIRILPLIYNSDNCSEKILGYIRLYSILLYMVFLLLFFSLCYVGITVVCVDMSSFNFSHHTISKI